MKILAGQPFVVEMEEDNNEGDIDHEGCREGETGWKIKIIQMREITLRFFPPGLNLNIVHSIAD